MQYTIMTGFVFVVAKEISVHSGGGDFSPSKWYDDGSFCYLDGTIYTQVLNWFIVMPIYLNHRDVCACMYMHE